MSRESGSRWICNAQQCYQFRRQGGRFVSIVFVPAALPVIGSSLLIPVRQRKPVDYLQFEPKALPSDSVLDQSNVLPQELGLRDKSRPCEQIL